MNPLIPMTKCGDRDFRAEATPAPSDHHHSLIMPTGLPMGSCTSEAICRATTTFTRHFRLTAPSEVEADGISDRPRKMKDIRADDW